MTRQIPRPNADNYNEILMGPKVAINWIIEHIRNPQADLKFKVAICQLHHFGFMEDEWAPTEPHSTLLKLLAKPEIALNPLLKQYWKNKNEAPMTRLLDAILAQALSDQATGIKMNFTSTKVTVDFMLFEEWSEVMTIPFELGNPLRGQIRFALEYNCPQLLVLAARTLHQQGKSPSVSKNSQSTITIDFVSNPGWLANREITPAKLEEFKTN